MTVDYSSYENHEQLAELDRQIKAIDPKLKFSYFNLKDKRVIGAGIVLLECGNAPIINKLLGIGFEKKRREKVKDYVSHYSGYQMQVRLEKDLR